MGYRSRVRKRNLWDTGSVPFWLVRTLDRGSHQQRGRAGPSSMYLRPLAPESMYLTDFGTRVLQKKYVNLSGRSSKVRRKGIRESTQMTTHTYIYMNIQICNIYIYVCVYYTYTHTKYTYIYVYILYIYTYVYTYHHSYCIYTYSTTPTRGVLLFVTCFAWRRTLGSINVPSMI